VEERQRIWPQGAQLTALDSPTSIAGFWIFIISFGRGIRIQKGTHIAESTRFHLMQHIGLQSSTFVDAEKVNATIW